MQYLGYLFYLVGLVCWVIMLISAFKSAPWKGIVGFFCGLYLLYYGITEFQHEKKWPIVVGYVVGLVLGYVFLMMGAAASMPR